LAGLSWRTILALGLLGLILGFGWGIADQPIYTATAGVAVESDSHGADTARLERFAQRGESAKVATKAAGLLGDDVAGADLLSDISVRPAPGGGAVIVRATSESPDYAAAAADGYAQALVDVEGDPLALGESASIPSSPSENRSAPRSAAIGLLAGLLFGLVVAIVIARTRRPAQGAETTGRTDPGETAEEAGDGGAGPGAPMLGSLGDLPAVASRLGLGVGSASAPESIAIAAVGDGSAGPDAAVGLAEEAAERGLRVLLVEADLAAPILASRLGVAPEPGLTDYLEGAASPREVLRTVRSEPGSGAAGFACVPAGAPGGDASIRGHRFVSLVGRLSRVYDLVIYSSPPVLAGEDAEALAGLVDAVIFAVAAGAGDDELEAAAEALRPARIAGLIACHP